MGGDGTLVVVGGMTGDVVGTGTVGGGGGGVWGDVIGGLVGGGGAGAEGDEREAVVALPVPEPDPNGDGCVVAPGPTAVAPFGVDVVTPLGTVVDGRAWTPGVTGTADVAPLPPAFDAEPAPPHAVARSTTAPRIQGFR